jgi:hypothetical protein
LDAKEARLVEAMKLKKKAKKVLAAAKSPVKDNGSSASFESENLRLRERETALMDAVSIFLLVLELSKCNRFFELGGRVIRTK